MSDNQAADQKQTMGFQTQAKQLLQLMIHSLYSNKEIFLRELVSNASDACDKLRFEALHNDALLAEQSELMIKIEADEENKTLTIFDTGIGMSQEEVIANLGTIARSGTAEFMAHLSGDQQKDSQLIGQFGVGFYSAFIVADKVEVFTRRAGLDASEGVHWESTGEDQFSVEAVDVPERGTRIVLHLKEGCEEFANQWRIQSIIKKYSDHISIPVKLLKTSMAPVEDGEEGETAEVTEWETINDATALWTKNKSDISDEDYQEFYKHISHDYQQPLTWSHNQVEGKLEYTSLLYIPSAAPFDLYNRDAARGLKLYVQRTFIMDEAEQFLPMYLRFVKGIVDSNDLSLNVSREILQQDPNINSMRSALTKRVLDMLTKLAKNDKDAYQKFWDTFGQVLKEGPAEDFTNKEKIAGLLRFSTTHTNKPEQDQSLDDYLARMPEQQDKIYYVAADSFNTAAHSPHLEVFRKKGIEVLLLSDRVDDWLMSHLIEYQGKSFQDVGRGQLDLGELDSEEDKKADEQATEANSDFINKVTKALDQQVQEVRVTHRLTESPACLVVAENDMGAQMRKILEQAGQSLPDTKPILEINIEHPLVAKLKTSDDGEDFDSLAMLLFEQAKLAMGDQLEDPAAFVNRINKLILEINV